MVYYPSAFLFRTPSFSIPTNLQLQNPRMQIFALFLGRYLILFKLSCGFFTYIMHQFKLNISVKDYGRSIR